jgi:hypothetical protein
MAAVMPAWSLFCTAVARLVKGRLLLRVPLAGAKAAGVVD